MGMMKNRKLHRLWKNKPVNHNTVLHLFFVNYILFPVFTIEDGSVSQLNSSPVAEVGDDRESLSVHPVSNTSPNCSGCHIYMLL